MSDETRVARLRANVTKLFWIRFFLNVRALAIVLPLFYVHRGLTLGQVFALYVVWGIVLLFAEVPSSWLADVWGRRPTIVLGAALFVLKDIIHLISYDFWGMLVANIVLGFALACLSGTDEALLYDSGRELGEESFSLSALGKFSSAYHLPKIVTVLVGAFVADRLLEGEFMILLIIDMAACVLAAIMAIRLTEPNHHIDLSEKRRGALRDAFELFVRDGALRRIIYSRDFVFVPVFGLMISFQVYFIGMGVSVVTIGVVWALYHTVTYILQRYIHEPAERMGLERTLNAMNLLIAGCFILFFSLVLVGAPPLSQLIVMTIAVTLVISRFPVYSELINRRCHSYNRATTLSLANVFRGTVQFILLSLSGVIISQGFIWLFTLVCAVVLLGSFGFRLHRSFDQSPSPTI